MTSISTAITSQYLSPLDLLQNQLQSEVSSGQIASSDQGALSSAIDDIGKALQSDASAGQSSGQPQSPQDLKSRVNDLIDSEVQSGKLTSAQGAELQKVFSDAFSQRADGAHGHHGGHHAHGASASASADGDSSSPADSLLTPDQSNAPGASATDPTALINQFLKSVQQSQSQSQGSGYSPSGNGVGAPQNSLFALVIDFQS